MIVVFGMYSKYLIKINTFAVINRKTDCFIERCGYGLLFEKITKILKGCILPIFFAEQRVYIIERGSRLIEFVR